MQWYRKAVCYAQHSCTETETGTEAPTQAKTRAAPPPLLIALQTLEKNSAHF